MALSLLLSAILLTTPSEQAVRQMTLEEKIGQLFVVPACPERGDDHLADLQKLIDQYHIGGILLKAGDQASYRRLYSNLSSPIPLLHMGDAEWGVSMRVKDAVKFPRNLTLGAIQDLSLIEEFGHQIGWECRQVGLQINAAPVGDVNTNPRNPVIGTRAWSDKPLEVAKRVNTVVVSLLEEGIASAVKHYPGHGDTSVDSHVDLPVVNEMQLEPFKQAIENGTPCIMTAHLFYRPLGEVVTFSSDLVEKKLREELKFKGLIITDALNMGALDKYQKVALKALAAGHDLLLYGDHQPDKIDRILRTDVPSAIEEIKQAVQNKELDEKVLDAHVKRIWEFKQVMPLTLPEETPLITPYALDLKKRLYQSAITMVANQHVPLKENSLVNLKQFGAPSENLTALLKGHLTDSPEAPTVVAIYEMTAEAKEFLKTHQPAIVVLLTTPYKLLEMSPAPTTIVAYERDNDAEEAVVDILWGKRKAVGKLPVNLAGLR